MGYKEIALLVMGLILTSILALAIAPSISASADATKASIIVNEIKSIEFATKMWAVNNSATADLTGLSADQIKGQIPNLTFYQLAYNSEPQLLSKSDGVKYEVRQYDTDHIQIIVKGIISIYDSRAAIVAQLRNIYGVDAITDQGNDFIVDIRK